MDPSFRANLKLGSSYPRPSKARLSNRCDQCNRKCIKCDRLQPICSQCRRSNITCTFDRKLKNKRPLHFLDDSISCFKGNPNPNLFSKGGQAPQLQLERKCLEPKFNLSQALGRKSLSNIFTLLQFPPNNIFLFEIPSLKALASIFFHHNYYHTFPKAVSRREVYSTEEQLYSQAIDSFFQHDGLVFAVCTPTTFKKRKRSPFFLQAVVVAGLLRLPETARSKVLLERLTATFQARVQAVASLPANFETLQTLIVFLSSFMVFPWARKYSYALLKHSVRLAQLLGAQFPNPKLPPWLRLERKLTYNSLTFLDLYSNLVSIPCSSCPIFFKSRLIVNKIDALIAGRSPEAPCCNIGTFAACFLQDLNYLMFQVFVIKCEFSEERKTSFVRADNSNRLLAKVDIICSRSVAKLTAKRFVDDPTITQSLTGTIHSTIHLFSYFLRYFLRSLNFYSINAIRHVDAEQHIKLTIGEAVRVLRYAVRIDPHRATFVKIACVSQCLVFVIRYRNFADAPDTITLIRAKQWLNELLSHASTHFYSSSNLCIINLIQQSFALH
ncbi:hypothetical protein L0F63_004746 [Massospora cicadina]|nr:hypothetical protein L0F63_004746 [Massospora cicadina]